MFGLFFLKQYACTRALLKVARDGVWVFVSHLESSTGTLDIRLARFTVSHVLKGGTRLRNPVNGQSHYSTAHVLIIKHMRLVPMVTPI